MRTLNIKRTYFDLIQNGRKTVEVRVGYNSIQRIQQGEQLLIQTGGGEMTVNVTAVRTYKNFEAMLATEHASAIVPGKGSAEVLGILKSIYPPDKERFGVYAFQLEVVA